MGRKERKERRQERLELEQERKRDDARTQPRSVGDDFGWTGAGIRRLQIVISESFEPVLCWDIRTDATIDVNGKHVDGTVVYESMGISPESERVSGYRRLDIAAQELDRLVESYS